jgi:hypothetical protein
MEEWYGVSWTGKLLGWKHCTLWTCKTVLRGFGIFTLYGRVVWRDLDWKIAWMETSHTVGMENSAAWIWNLSSDLTKFKEMVVYEG